MKPIELIKLSKPPQVGQVLYHINKIGYEYNFFVVGKFERGRIYCKDTQAIYSLKECSECNFSVVDSLIDQILDMHPKDAALIVHSLSKYRPSVKQLVWSGLKDKWVLRDKIIGWYLKTQKLMATLPNEHPCSAYSISEWIEDTADNPYWIGHPSIALRRLDWFWLLYGGDRDTQGGQMIVRQTSIDKFVCNVTTSQTVYLVVVDDPLASLLMAGKANIFTMPDALPSHVKRVGIHVKNLAPKTTHFQIAKGVYPNDKIVESIANKKAWELHTTHLLGFVDIRRIKKPDKIEGINRIVNWEWENIYQTSNPSLIKFGYAEKADYLSFPAPLEVLQQFHRHIKG